MLNIRKIMAITVLSAVSMSFTAGSSVWASSVTSKYTASVYDTEGSGLALKEKPDLDSQRITVIPEDEILNIDGITSSGWGYTSYDGFSGWVSLKYTKAGEDCVAETPTSGTLKPVYYMVKGTDGEGLELRTRPSAESSTYGAIEDDKVVLVRAIQDNWAYVSYSDHCGWLSTAYIRKWEVGKSFKVRVYDTDGGGLALKAEADINSERYMLIPEGTDLVIDGIASGGWGHVVYEEQPGWIALRYTKAAADTAADIPGDGYIKPKYYRVVSTSDEGLELRMKASVDSSSFGNIPEGEQVYVHAVKDDWAFACVDGQYGWLNMKYLKERE